MNFQGLQGRFQRLFAENAAWKLLRADNAALILAFMADLFSEDNEVPFGRARVALDAEIERCVELGIWQTTTGAGAYLRQWIQAGWLRELDDHLTKTDACEVALRFCQGLDQRDTNTTASHLRIVQEAVRDFAVAISPNPADRLALLNSRKAQIQREINDIKAGVVIELSQEEQRERIREIYQLASVLTGDFRRVEDEIRELDQQLRVQMIQSESSRGDILLSVLEKEQLLAKTDAGSAFESFFQLLCDPNRSAEFRDQLQSTLSRPAASNLSSQQQRFLAKLMRELTRESDRVFQIRRRTAESLRAYIESGALFESRAVDNLLGKLERLAVSFKNVNVDLRTQTKLWLPVANVHVRSPDSLRLKTPEEKLDTTGVQTQVNATTPNSEMLDSLDAVKMLDVARVIADQLQRHGPMTIGGIVEKQPLTAGLEELVAFVRVAKSVGATALGDKEQIAVTDKKGAQLSASIPRFLLSSNLFPDNIEEVVI